MSTTVRTLALIGAAAVFGAGAALIAAVLGAPTWAVFGIGAILTVAAADYLGDDE